MILSSKACCDTPNLSEPPLKCFLLNACLLCSRIVQTGKVHANKGWDNRTKCEMARVKQQAFIFRIAGVHSSFERRVNITLQYLKNTEKYRIFNIMLHRGTHSNAQNKTAKYFLKIKGHKHNIFSLQIGQDKTERSALTSPQHQYCLLYHNHCL